MGDTQNDPGVFSELHPTKKPTPEKLLIEKKQAGGGNEPRIAENGEASGQMINEITEDAKALPEQRPGQETSDKQPGDKSVKPVEPSTSVEITKLEETVDLCTEESKQEQNVNSSLESLISESFDDELEKTLKELNTSGISTKERSLSRDSTFTVEEAGEVESRIYKQAKIDQLLAMFNKNASINDISDIFQQIENISVRISNIMPKFWSISRKLYDLKFSIEIQQCTSKLPVGLAVHAREMQRALSDLKSDYITSITILQNRKTTLLNLCIKSLKDSVSLYWRLKFVLDVLDKLKDSDCNFDIAEFQHGLQHYCDEMHEIMKDLQRITIRFYDLGFESNAERKSETEQVDEDGISEAKSVQSADRWQIIRELEIGRNQQADQDVGNLNILEIFNEDTDDEINSDNSQFSDDGNGGEDSYNRSFTDYVMEFICIFCFIVCVIGRSYKYEIMSVTAALLFPYLTFRYVDYLISKNLSGGPGKNIEEAVKNLSEKEL